MILRSIILTPELLISIYNYDQVGELKEILDKGNYIHKVIPIKAMSLSLDIQVHGNVNRPINMMCCHV